MSGSATFLNRQRPHGRVIADPILQTISIVAEDILGGRGMGTALSSARGRQLAGSLASRAGWPGRNASDFRPQEQDCPYSHIELDAWNNYDCVGC